MRRGRPLGLHYPLVSRWSHFHRRTVATRITPMTRSGLQPLPLPALIANEYLRLNGWSDHVDSVFPLSAKVYSYGDSLLIARYWGKSKHPIC